MQLTRKDLLVKNMKRTQRFLAKAVGKEESDRFDFIAPTYVMPQDYSLFQEEFRKNPKAIWIMKPVGKSQGRGIFLFNKLSQISQWKKDPRTNRDDPDAQIVEAYIAQRYIDRPYLIGGRKFDIRLYALVSSYSPLVVHIHRIGFCRFSNYQFSLAKEDISNICTPLVR